MHTNTHSRTHTPAHTKSRVHHIVTALHLFFVTATVSAATKASAQTQPQYLSAGLITYATVIQPLGINAIHNLEFGTVIVGTTKTISPTLASAGQFQIHGQSDANIAVTFALPTALNLTGTGEAQLPITDWTYATSNSSSTVTGDATPGSPITQGGPMNFTLPTNPSGPAMLALGIGATATASPSQATGDYIGLGDITIAYTDY